MVLLLAHLAWSVKVDVDVIRCRGGKRTNPPRLILPVVLFWILPRFLLGLEIPHELEIIFKLLGICDIAPKELEQTTCVSFPVFLHEATENRFRYLACSLMVEV